MKIRVKKSRARLRKESRTIAVWGSPERGDGLDHNKWYRCWNCGWLNNVDKKALGDSQSLDGLTMTEYTPAVYSGAVRLGESLIAQENDADGNPKTPVRHYKPTSNSGCGFCGSLNWRGDY